jgi:hypothetical protein
VANGTVVDVQDGALVHYGDGAFPAAADNCERWDGDILLNIAAFAAAYYGKARYAANLTIQEASLAHYPGSMIYAAVGDSYFHPLCSIVSSRVIDLQEQKTLVTTAVFDLKFDELYEAPGV